MRRHDQDPVEGWCRSNCRGFDGATHPGPCIVKLYGPLSAARIQADVRSALRRYAEDEGGASSSFRSTTTDE